MVAEWGELLNSHASSVYYWLLLCITVLCSSLACAVVHPTLPKIDSSIQRYTAAMAFLHLVLPHQFEFHGTCTMKHYRFEQTLDPKR
jgi:hypothetical protein